MQRGSSRAARCLPAVLLLLVAAAALCKATSPLDITTADSRRELLATGFANGFNDSQIECACLRAVNQ